MSEENSIVGNYRVEATENLTLVARGDQLSIRAMSGGSGNVLVDASTAVSIMCGPAFVAVENELLGSKVIVCGGELGTLVNCVGPPLEGAQIKMLPELVTITVGAPGEGSSIAMTPDSITFKVGEVTWTMTPAGIVEDVAEVTREMTAEGHNLTAGEAEYNLNVSGEDKESPVKAEEVEGGVVENDTMEHHSIDAIKDEEAAMEITA